MAYVSQGSRTNVKDASFVCVVKFDGDLPNGPFVEGSAGNLLQPGPGFSVSVPPTGATWGLVAELVAKHHQAELDKLHKLHRGEMQDMGVNPRMSWVATCVPKNVMYKGGAAPNDGPVQEGSCTVLVTETYTITSEVGCCVIL